MPGADRPRGEQLASADSAGHDPPSAWETRIDRRPADPSSDLVLPEIGTNCESYLRNTERYIADREIEVTGDPLSQLVPPHLAADIRRTSNVLEAIVKVVVYGFSNVFTPQPAPTLSRAVPTRQPR